MAKNKTTENNSSVEDFINKVKDETRRNNCFTLIKLLQGQTKLEPKMWGPSIVGFGSYHYKYDTGREGDAPLIAFSPRASSIALYLSGSFEQREELLAKFGKHKTDRGCIHIKTLADIDVAVFQQMVSNHLKYMQQQHPNNKCC